MLLYFLSIIDNNLYFILYSIYCFQYFILGHQLLANVSGFQGARIRHNLTWERVVNLKGHPAGNIGLDLLNEFMVNDFKGKNTQPNMEEWQYDRIDTGL